MNSNQLEHLVNLNKKIENKREHFNNLLKRVNIKYRIEIYNIALTHDENPLLYTEITNKIIEFHKNELNILENEFKNYVFAKNEN